MTERSRTLGIAQVSCGTHICVVQSDERAVGAFAAQLLDVSVTVASTLAIGQRPFDASSLLLKDSGSQILDR